MAKEPPRPLLHRLAFAALLGAQHASLAILKVYDWPSAGPLRKEPGSRALGHTWSTLASLPRCPSRLGSALVGHCPLGGPLRSSCGSCAPVAISSRQAAISRRFLIRVMVLVALPSTYSFLRRSPLWVSRAAASARAVPLGPARCRCTSPTRPSYAFGG
eukprot:9186689-Alexandrium_andersonii.AAC.1